MRISTRFNDVNFVTKNFHVFCQQNNPFLRQNGSGLRRCSYFDPSVPNGGPRPETETSKRAAEPWVAMELCALGELDQCLDSDTRHRREAEDLDFDPFDAYENELQEARSGAAVRLSDDIALALRQVCGQFSDFSAFFKFHIVYFSSELGFKNGVSDIFPNVMARKIMVSTLNVFVE